MRNLPKEGMLFNNSVLLAIRNTASDRSVNKDIILSCSEMLVETFEEFDKRMEQRYNKQISSIKKINL